MSIHSASASGKRPAVNWNEVETNAVVRESWRLMRDDPTMPGKTALLQAQNACLSKERRKQAICFHPWSRTEKWFIPAVAKLEAERTKDEAQATTTNEVEAEQEQAKKAQKVFWTAEEKARVARRCVEILSAAPMKLLDVLRLASDDMPEGRRRPIRTISPDKEWLEAQIKLEREALEREAREEAARKTEDDRIALEEQGRREREEKEAAERITAAAAAQAAEEKAARAAGGIDGLLVELGKRIAAQLLDKVGASLESMIVERVNAALVNVAVTSPVPMPYEGVTKLTLPPKERKARVCVVGLLNQQVEDVQRAFKQIDFVFVKSQATGGSGHHGGAGMLARASSCDLVIAMTDFLGHDVDFASKKLTIPFVRVVGSVSALKRWLQSWSNGEIALANHGS